MASLEGAFGGGMVLAVIGTLIGAVVGMAGLGYWIWFNAPVVGGDYWFYIRILTTLVGISVGASIGSIAGYIGGMVAGGVLGGILG